MRKRLTSGSCTIVEVVRSPIFPSFPWESHPAISCEGVVNVGDGGDVPRVAGHGACQEGAGVVNEVQDDRFHEFLRKPVVRDARYTSPEGLQRSTS